MKLAINLKKYIFSTILFLFSLIVAYEVKGEERHSYTTSHVKAAYILHITDYIKWVNKTYPEEVCIISNDKIGDLLADTQKSDVQWQKLSIKKSFSEDSLSKCDIVYIDKKVEEAKLIKIIQKTSNDSTLLISDYSDFIDLGGTIGFAEVDGRIKIDINLDKLEKSKLLINSELLSITNRVIDSSDKSGGRS